MFYNLNFSGQGRWQELQVPVLPHPQGAHAEEEPQEDHLDRSVPQVLLTIILDTLPPLSGHRAGSCSLLYNYELV